MKALHSIKGKAKCRCPVCSKRYDKKELKRERKCQCGIRLKKLKEDSK